MYVLDTNVISELRKARTKKADPRVVEWVDSVLPESLFLSAVVVHELEYGVLLVARRDAKQGALLRAWLAGHVLPTFEGRILPVDTAVAIRSADLIVPHPRPFRDALIAATAYVHGLTVVTRNVRDFEGMNVPVLNPWRGQN